MKKYLFLLLFTVFLNEVHAQVQDNLVNSSELYVQGIPWYLNKNHPAAGNVGVRLKYNFSSNNWDYTGGDWRSFNNLVFHGSDLHFVAAETWQNSNSFPSTMSTQDLINDYSKMTFIGHSGHFGIGTKDPHEKLHINNGKIKISDISPRVEFFESDVNQSWFLFADATSFSIKPYNTTTTNHLQIKNNGDVCIGTSNTGGFKLSVAGNIRAYEVKVYNTWADYVFNDDYDLMSLKDVETYIDRNKHLPGIPSAQEIEENEGINLGEMQKLQMAKIEELTLHLIAQQKQLNQQSDLLKKQEELIQQLLVR